MIQWFPGHMAKTGRLIKENMGIVDVVIELADARLPESSRNPLLNEMIGEKPRVLVLAKEDLAEKERTNEWKRYYLAVGIEVVALNALSLRKHIKKELLEKIRAQAEPVLQKRKSKGILNKTITTMVVGIPNVGKSTLINTLAGKASAPTGDRPGVTKGKQWITLGKGVELLDTPGILWHKIDEKITGLKLAATGAIKDQVFDIYEVSLWLIEWLTSATPGRIKNRYKIEEDLAPQDLLRAISYKRGFLKSGGEPDCEKGAVMLLDEFRGGKLGPVTMDRIPDKYAPDPEQEKR